MTVFYTSDLHIGHANIIRLSNRPFRDVDHMNWSIVNNWNSIVDADDTVWILGDLALGSIVDSMAIVEKLNGKKNLIPGNHDRVWDGFYSKGVRPDHVALYEAAGLKIWNHVVMDTDPRDKRWIWVMCHFPDEGDSHDEDRFTLWRPQSPDARHVLLHGHTHRRERLSGPNRVHVGMDAWDYRPVAASEICELLARQWV